MKHYSQAAVERAMKRQEVILRAIAKKITWWQAAEILGISCRHMRRVRERYEEFGYDGLFNRRTGRPSPKRVPLETVELVLTLYRERYFDFNVRHFHERLGEEHGITLSYTWVKKALQESGLVKKTRTRRVHRKRRERRPLPGMLLHIDASTHRWFGDGRRHDLIVVLDDATSEVYYAQVVEEEGTREVMAALRQVVEQRGLFCALYSDRAGHFFYTPRKGETIDADRLTQVGRAMRQLGIRMIPAYSPQARGRSERSFGTWQGRLPQELRLRGITTPEEANRYLRDEYVRVFNARFARPAREPGTAFVPVNRSDLDLVFSLQHERSVGRDNTVQWASLCLQIEPQRWRSTLSGCRVTVYDHSDGTLSLGYGPHLVGRYSADGRPLTAAEVRRKLKQKILTNRTSDVLHKADILTGGERHESPHAPELIEGYSMQVLIADKGYDDADFIEALTGAGVEAVIPPRVNRKEQREYDAHLYRERHLVECLINKIKHYRRVFSRFEKLAKNYLGFLSFVSALVWLR